MQDQQYANPAPQGPRRTHRVRNSILAVTGLGLALGNGIGAASGGSHPAASQAPAPPATSAPATPLPASPPPPPANTAPAAPPVASQAPATPAGPTVSQQQAISAAQDYLNLGSGFSHASLVKQLTSQYGSGFSAADAEFAVSYLHPDWNAQAAEAARGYMNLGTGFSRASLIQQLTSPYGNEFTEAQAEYAASQVGL